MTAFDTSAGHRALWAGFVWTLAGVLTLLGVSYAFGSLPSSSAYLIVTQYVPGGMRTHGVIMVGLGAALLAGLLAPVRLPRRTVGVALTAVCAYTVWLIVSFAGSWLLSGQFPAAPLVWWAAGGVAHTILLIMLPPPNYPRGLRDPRRARRGR